MFVNPDEEILEQMMDDAAWHLESIREKQLQVDERTAYNHLAIYLRWCIEHSRMSKEFLHRYSAVVEKIQKSPWDVDLREFVRDELHGLLLYPYFDDIGCAFARHYYGDGSKPYFPSDIDSYAMEYFGEKRYHSNGFQDEAYLFVPFNEDYYQAISKVIEHRWEEWQLESAKTRKRESTLPSLAEGMMDYLHCPCLYLPPMKSDTPIKLAYQDACKRGQQGGFVPMLVAVDDTLWECLLLNSEGDCDGADDVFDKEEVAKYRQTALTDSMLDGKAVLERKEEAQDDDLDWSAEILGEMANGEGNDEFLGYWDYPAEQTLPLLLVEIPVKNPWEVFAYLPFGGWNECPDTPELMAVTKYWFEQYGARPAVITHDVLELTVPAPVPKERAMELAQEQYAFCPDVVDQGPPDTTVGMLADSLRQSRAWYFWWD